MPSRARSRSLDLNIGLELIIVKQSTKIQWRAPSTQRLSVVLGKHTKLALLDALKIHFQKFSH